MSSPDFDEVENTLEYVVKLRYEAELVTTIRAAPDVSRDQLQEMALVKADEGTASFNTTWADIEVTYKKDFPVPLHLLTERLRHPL